jgi:integrase
MEAHLLKLAGKHASQLDLRLHDLRRTAGSMMLDSGVTPEVIAVVLNNPSSVKVYTRLRNKVAQARAALEAHGQALETAVAKPA